MKVYIAGAISGHNPDEVDKKFTEAVEFLKSKNFAVLNPVKIVNNPHCSSRTAMKVLVPLLLQCDAIYLLRDWKFSEGAQIEASLARYTGMKIMHEEDFNDN